MAFRVRVIVCLLLVVVSAVSAWGTRCGDCSNAFIGYDDFVICFSETSDKSKSETEIILSKFLPNHIINKSPKIDKKFTIFLREKGKRNIGNSDDNLSFTIEKNRAIIEYCDCEDALNKLGIFLREFCGIKFFVPSEIGIECESGRRIKRGVYTTSPSFKGRAIGYAKKSFAGITGQEFSYMGSNHYLSRLIDENITTKNPEFLAEVGGVREKWSPSAMIDFRNGGLRQFIKNHSHEYFKKNPERKVYSLSYADSTAFADDKYSLMYKRGLTPNGYADFSNLVFSFSNDIARYFKKAHPDKLVSTLAYINSENPPSIPLEDNIIVYLCGDRGNYFNEEARERDINLMKAWRKRGVKHFGIYDYNYGKDYFIPRNITHHIADGLKNAYAQGARYYYCEMYPNWAYDACKYWVLSNLLIDIDADPIELENEFYRDFYKETATDVRRFFDIAKEQWDARKDVPMWLTLYKRDGQAEVFSAEALAKMECALQSAETSAKTLVVKMRVYELRLMFDITKSYIHTYNLQKKLWLLSPKDKNFSAKVDDISQAIDVSKRTLRVYLDKYKNNTKYPKVDFSAWDKLDYMDPSQMRLQQAKDPNFSGVANIIEYIDKTENGKINFSKWTFKHSPNVYSNVERFDKSIKMSSWLPAYFYRTFVVPPNKEYRFSMDVSGNLDLGAVFYIEMAFYDKNKKLISQTRQRLPSMKNFSWMPIFVQAYAPENTATVNIAMFSISMRPSDFVELKNIKFQMK